MSRRRRHRLSRWPRPRGRRRPSAIGPPARRTCPPTVRRGAHRGRAEGTRCASRRRSRNESRRRRDRARGRRSRRPRLWPHRASRNRPRRAKSLRAQRVAAHPARQPARDRARARSPRRRDCSASVKKLAARSPAVAADESLASNSFRSSTTVWRSAPSTATRAAVPGDVDLKSRVADQRDQAMRVDDADQVLVERGDAAGEVAAPDEEILAPGPGQDRGREYSPART